MTEIQVGNLLLYRVFDVGEEIDLRKVEALLEASPSERRVRISPGKPTAMIVKDAPIRVQLGRDQVTLLDRTYPCEITATIWNYAAISIRFQVSLAGLNFDDLEKLSQHVTGTSPALAELERAAAARCRDLARVVEPAVTRPGISPIFEDYTIYQLEKVAGVTSCDELEEKLDLPALVFGEARDRLAERARAHAWDGLYQYTKHDLTLISWDSALVFDSDGGWDVADVLEFALTHLLELRVYDDLLDQRLGEVYDSVELSRRRLLRSPVSRIISDANSRYIEFSEFTDRIGNSLKVVGDYYLATIFRGAARRFRTADWQTSIESNMKVLAEVSGLLQGELNFRKSYVLEVVVVVLILFEILMPLVKLVR